MELQCIKIELPADTQIILAQSHFIKTIEDVSECLVNCVPNIKYGVAFCEASGPRLVRHNGNESNYLQQITRSNYLQDTVLLF